MRSRWKRIRYRLEWIGLLLAAKLIPLFSRRACYYLAQTGGALMPTFDRHHYKVALSNLEVAFGDQFSKHERRKIARKSFQHFARTMVDLFWSPRLTRENFRDYIECFGLKTSVTSAHASLHKQTGVPIIPVHCEPLVGGRYRVVFHGKIDSTEAMTLQQIAQACWNSFEPYVRKNPAPWLWMYKHWRYLPSNPARPYPFYANFFRPFEDMLQRNRADTMPGTQL